MPRQPDVIAADIDAFEPVNGIWLQLDALLEELFATGHAEIGIPSLLRVFARFPEDDGAGVFWAIVHGLESLRGYEQSVVTAVADHPTEFSLLMVNRMLNAGQTHVGSVALLELLKAVAGDSAASEPARRAADRFVEHQHSRKQTHD